MQAWRARDKATPVINGQPLPPATKVRHDIIDQSGTVALRYRSRLHHIGIGRLHRGRRVLILAAELNVRVIAEDGTLLRHFTLDPTVDYQAPVSGYGLKVRLSQKLRDSTERPRLDSNQRTRLRRVIRAVYTVHPVNRSAPEQGQLSTATNSVQARRAV